MYHLIVNGNTADKKADKKLALVERVFKAAGKQLTVHKTERAGHAKALAKSISGEGAANIIAMGGDGTLHEVLNGIENVENCTLGLIPLGTGNDFANAAKIPLDVKKAAEIIAFRAPVGIDYIQLDSGLKSINAIGSGIDVDALKLAYASTKGKKTKYFPAFLKSLKNYKAYTYRASWDGGEEREFNGLIACIGNGRQIGGGIKLFPKAEISDGYMDLVIVDYLSKIRTVFAFLKLITGRINKVKEVTYVKCKSVNIKCMSGEMTVQAEGELYDGVPLNAKVVTDKLKFYLP